MSASPAPHAPDSDAGGGWWPFRRRPPGLDGRRRAAAGRLEAARRGFDRSVVALRTAALDHVDSQDLTSLTLRLFLDRLAGSGRNSWGGEGGMGGPPRPSGTAGAISP